MPWRRSVTPARRRCPATVVRCSPQLLARVCMSAPASYSPTKRSPCAVVSRRCACRGSAGVVRCGRRLSRAGSSSASRLTRSFSFELPPVWTTPQKLLPPGTSLLSGGCLHPCDSASGPERVPPGVPRAFRRSKPARSADVPRWCRYRFVVAIDACPIQAWTVTGLRPSLGPWAAPGRLASDLIRSTEIRSPGPVARPQSGPGLGGRASHFRSGPRPSDFAPRYGSPASPSSDRC